MMDKSTDDESQRLPARVMCNQVYLFVLTLHNRNRHQRVLDPPPLAFPFW